MAEKNFLIQLTNDLYRLTILFPKKEPLRYKIRQWADEILANFIQLETKQKLIGDRPVNNNFSLLNQVRTLKRQILEDLEVLDSFFEIAKSQKWVSLQETINLQEEYVKLKEELEKEQMPEMLFPEGEKRLSINERQQKILEVLKERGKVQVWEIKKIFPDVSKRTLRRDFEQMLSQGLIERIGERNETFYQLKP